MKIFIAFIFTPIIPVLIWLFLKSIGVEFSWLKMIPLITVMYGYPSLLIFGVPAYIYSLAHNKFNFKNAVLTGALIGFSIPLAILSFMYLFVFLVSQPLDIPDQEGLLEIAGLIFIGFIFGCIYGGSFYGFRKLLTK